MFYSTVTLFAKFLGRSTIEVFFFYNKKERGLPDRLDVSKIRDRTIPVSTLDPTCGFEIDLN